MAHAAVHLAKKYGGDAKKAELAGWIHDCAKELKLDEMRAVVKDAGLALDEHMLASRALLHGPAGSILARTRYDVDDEEIAGAIFYHTTGRPDMTLMEKIIFLADYIEPQRDFPGVEELRRLAEIDLDRALIASYDCTLRHLMDEGDFIYELTFQGRNNLVLRLKDHR